MGLYCDRSLKRRIRIFLFCFTLNTCRKIVNIGDIWLIYCFNTRIPCRFLSGILFCVVTIVIRRTPCLLNAAVQSHVPLIITKMSFMMIYPRTMSQTNHLIVVLFSTPDNSSDNSPRGISNSSFNCFCSHSEVLFL